MRALCGRRIRRDRSRYFNQGISDSALADERQLFPIVHHFDKGKSRLSIGPRSGSFFRQSETRTASLECHLSNAANVWFWIVLAQPSPSRTGRIDTGRPHRESNSNVSNGNGKTALLTGSLSGARCNHLTSNVRPLIWLRIRQSRISRAARGVGARLPHRDQSSGRRHGPRRELIVGNGRKSEKTGRLQFSVRCSERFRRRVHWRPDGSCRSRSCRPPTEADAQARTGRFAAPSPASPARAGW